MYPAPIGFGSTCMTQEALDCLDSIPRDTSVLGHIFMKIPGTLPDKAASSIAVEGNLTPVADVLALIRSRSPIDNDARALMQLLIEAPLSRSELHLVASSLLSIAHTSPSAADALYDLLMAPRDDLEAAYVAIQLIKVWGGLQERAAVLSRLISSTETTLQDLRFSPDAPRKQLAETRYLLVRAFENVHLHSVALSVARTILIETNSKTISERKELAGALLSAASHVQPQTDTLSQFKRLAAAVFATGIAPAHLHMTQNNPSRRRVSFLVTAQDAERRRQFGLASAIELHKATTLLGREMSVAEYESAVAFHADASAVHPGNLSWFTREEWTTAYQLFTAGLEQKTLPHEHALALIHLLITKVKVEDTTDSRVSFKRLDLLDAPTRRKKLSELMTLARHHETDEALVTSMSQEKVSRLHQQGFLVRNPVQVSLDSESASPDHALGTSPLGTNSATLSCNNLVTRLARDNNPTFISRLVAADFHLLKQASGLNAEEFRIVLERIRGRAISEQWARHAFLEILRAPHSPEVTTSARTVALGLLVTEARKLGKLTSSFEKEVFAVSAELPNLPSAAASSDSETASGATSEV